MVRGSVDERGFEMVRRMRRSQGGMQRLSLADFKALVREQYLMLLVDPDASLAAIPSMLPDEPETRNKALQLLRQALSARGDIDEAMAQRLQQIDGLFGLEPARSIILPAAAVVASDSDVERRKAS